MMAGSSEHLLSAFMYDDFYALDRWTGKKLHCIYQALFAAIATRHADAVDVKFLVEGRGTWIALPHPAWVEYHRQTGKIINDPLAVHAAGHYLREAIESGLDNGREIYTLTVNETLQHVRAVLEEFNAPPEALPRVQPPATVA
jgi:hypothetical protein